MIYLPSKRKSKVLVTRPPANTPQSGNTTANRNTILQREARKRMENKEGGDRELGDQKGCALLISPFIKQ